MKKRTDSQNKRMHALLSQLGMMERKEDLVFSFSSGKTTSSSELSISEADSLILFLEKEVRVNAISSKNGLTPDEYKKGEASRRKLFSLVFQLPDHLRLTYLDGGKTKLNYKAIDTFITGNRFKNDKPLNALKQIEISKINSILEKMVFSYEKQKANALHN